MSTSGDHGESVRAGKWHSIGSFWPKASAELAVPGSSFLETSEECQSTVGRRTSMPSRRSTAPAASRIAHHHSTTADAGTRLQHHQLGARGWQGHGPQGRHGRGASKHASATWRMACILLSMQELNRPVMIQFSEGGSAFAACPGSWTSVRPVMRLSAVQTAVWDC